MWCHPKECPFVFKKYRDELSKLSFSVPFKSYSSNIEIPISIICLLFTFQLKKSDDEVKEMIRAKRKNVVTERSKNGTKDLMKISIWKMIVQTHRESLITVR